MTPEDYKQLEELLSKLHSDLGYKRYCIIPQWINDGVYIGLYNSAGDICATGMSYNIQAAVDDAKKSLGIKKEFSTAPI